MFAGSRYRTRSAGDRYDWDVADAVLKQSAGVELRFTVCST
ncbi:MAG: hypothetical protein QOG20_3090 [Pseudonocardiales bacterium]|jgi:hypothetical protein|nr:hypothetical protein [Pseudonocardiales bacterium]